MIAVLFICYIHVISATTLRPSNFPEILSFDGGYWEIYM